LIGKGCGTRTIAGRLRLGLNTVGTYRARIKEKLGLEGGQQLLQAAIRSASNRCPGAESDDLR